AEEMQRPIPVTAEERNGEEVEEPAGVPLQAVARPAMLSPAMVDGDLRDAISALVSEHRHEAVELAVEVERPNHLGPIRLEPAVHVVKTHAGDQRGGPVVDAGDDAAGQGVLAIALPARDEIEAFVELREQVRNLSGIVLEIRV